MTCPGARTFDLVEEFLPASPAPAAPRRPAARRSRDPLGPRRHLPESHTLAAADPEQVWARLAMLPQDIAREHIALGQDEKSEGDDQAVLTAVKASGADEVIAQLPDGLDTNFAPSHWGTVTRPEPSGSAWPAPAPSTATRPR
ncbi:hypothetical protein ACFVQ4_33075 [Streptomyces laurentii]|uniref:hypothetical protein n=1 Tax=Streptomyces laurentii TaxID=39478 RepID=UPI0036A39EC4